MLGYYIGMDLSEMLNLLVIHIFCLSGFLLCAYFIVRNKMDINISKRLLVLRKNNTRTLMHIILLLFLISIGLFFILIASVYILDKSTTVNINEKIVIIEIDDYWNLNDTEMFFEPYGYTFERFKEVSDVLDKNHATATLGVTPYIFVEEIRKDYSLEKDEKMISYLKELQSRGYELGMHGYNHCRNAQYCPKYEEIWYNVFQGKKELEDIFEVPFVSYFPPGNYWTDEQYDNVKKAGFKIIGNTHVPNAYYDENVIITPRAYDPIWHYAWYQKDFRHTNVQEWIDDYNTKNLFVLQLHCNTFDSKEKLEDLDQFLQYVNNDGAKIMTYQEFYNYIQEQQSAKHKDLSMTGNIVVSDY